MFDSVWMVRILFGILGFVNFVPQILYFLNLKYSLHLRRFHQRMVDILVNDSGIEENERGKEKRRGERRGDWKGEEKERKRGEEGGMK